MRRWTLERKGWRVAGTVSGRTETECERRFFESWTAKAATPEPGQRGISPDPGSSGPEPDPAAPGSPAAQSA